MQKTAYPKGGVKGRTPRYVKHTVSLPSLSAGINRVYYDQAQCARSLAGSVWHMTFSPCQCLNPSDIMPHSKTPSPLLGLSVTNLRCAHSLCSYAPQRPMCPVRRSSACLIRKVISWIFLETMMYSISAASSCRMFVSSLQQHM